MSRRFKHRKHTKRHLHHTHFVKKKNQKKIFLWVIFLIILFALVINYNKINLANFTNNSPTYENPITKSYSNGIELILHQNVYDYFRNTASHEYSAYYIPDDWEEDYYKMFLSNSKDEYIIKDIVNQITTSTNSDGDKAVKKIVSFVQNIPYDWASLDSQSMYMKYPYEVLYENKGVCGEKAILMAKLLNELGYGVALFNYENEEHMAVGIDCSYDKSNYNSGYCFIEPSDVYPIGQIPQEYVGGANIRTATPTIIKISQGKSYSK